MTERLGFSTSSGFSVGERRALLVGRVAEMRALEGALADVRQTGATRILTVLGSSGVGKTRLVREFLVRVSAVPDRATRVYRGSARDERAAFGVFARILRARFGITEALAPEVAMERVRAQVAAVLRDGKVGDVVYFLGHLLGLRFPDSPLIKAVEGDVHQMHMLRRAIIRRFLEEDSAPTSNTRRSAGPLVLVFDDLHAAQDESLELLDSLIDTLNAPILIVALARPELLARREAWQGRGGERHTTIELSPLSDTDSAAVMHDLLSPCGDTEETEPLIDAACTLAGGNPALLEQMVRIFLDRGVLEPVSEAAEEERWMVHVERLADVRLPLTVEDAVQARIAALTPAERNLLERAATMGGVFWLGGLLAIHRQDESAPEFWSAAHTSDVGAVRELLSELIERDYVLRLPDSTFSGDEEYVFKHNLEREALVRMTPAGARQRYHAVIGDWLAFKESVAGHEEHLTMLAQHREKAGARALAAKAYLEAADAARAHYGNAKAAELYAKGIALIKDGAIVDPGQRLVGLHHYGDVLQSLGRNEEALLAFHEMKDRSYRLDLRARGGAAHSRIGRLYRETGRLDAASRHLAAALSLFEQSMDERGIASTVDDIGKLHWLRGDYPRALEFTQRALATRRKIGDRRSIALSLNNLGLVFQDSGQFQKALDSFEQALGIRREIGDLVGVSVTLNNLGTIAQDQRDDRRALAFFTEAYDIAKETGDHNRIALILTNVGETYNRLGDAALAITYLRQAEELADELGDKLGLAEALRGLGKAYLVQREFVKARDCTARAVDLFREVQSRVQLGVALRSLGEVGAAATAGGDSLLQARGHVLQSISIFEDIGNEIELARSCRAYAQLLQGTPEFHTDADVANEVAEFMKRADDIFAKLRASLPGPVSTHRAP
jgi:tetratricopeptide (TPR) repeat protein/type II secretory pathway predicted ATPase ExeA